MPFHLTWFGPNALLPCVDVALPARIAYRRAHCLLSATDSIISMPFVGYASSLTHASATNNYSMDMSSIRIFFALCRLLAGPAADPTAYACAFIAVRPYATTVI